MICTRPGRSPRTTSTLATTSSLRMWFLAMCSMVNASGTRQLGGALAHSIAKRFGKSRIVEDPDLPRRKKSRHSFRVTGSRQRAGDDDPVIAGEHPGEALAVTLRQRLPQPPLLLPASP